MALAIAPPQTNRSKKYLSNLSPSNPSVYRRSHEPITVCSPIEHFFEVGHPDIEETSNCDLKISSCVCRTREDDHHHIGTVQWFCTQYFGDCRSTWFRINSQILQRDGK